MNTIRIAYRNMSRQRKRSLLLGGAIAFGILVITVINGLAAGILDNVKENFSNLSGGHIFVRGSETTETGRVLRVIRDDLVIRETIEELGIDVRYLTKRSSFRGTLLFGSREVNESISGVNWDGESFFADRLVFVEGNLDGLDDPKALILSRPTAEKLGVQVGETVLVRLSTVTGQQNVDEFRVIALTADEGTFGMNQAYAHIDYVNELLNIDPNEYQSLNIYLEDMDAMDDVADELYRALTIRVDMQARQGEQAGGAAGVGGLHGGMMTRGGGGPAAAMRGFFGFGGGATWEGTRYSLTTLNEMMSVVEELISLLNTIGLGIFVVLLVITMVGITNTFRMILLERTREIGTMRAVGLQRVGVRNIFLLEALFVALGGAVAGLAASGIVMGVVSLIPLSGARMLTMFLRARTLSFAVLPGQLILNVTIVIALILAAAYLPARKAARLDPANALRAVY